MCLLSTDVTAACSRRSSRSQCAWAAACAAALLAAPRLRGADAGADALPARLLQVASAIHANVEAQGRAWPTREQDQLSETLPPLAVQQLQVDERALLAEKAQLLRLLEGELQNDLSAGTRLLGVATDLQLIGDLVPRLLRAAREPEALEDSFLKLAARLTPCPSFLVKALGDIGSPRANEFLLKLGKDTASVAAFCAAARSGEASVLVTLLDWADAQSGPLAELALKAVERLEPPARPTAARIESLVAARAKELQVTDAVALSLLKSALREAPSTQCLDLTLSRLATAQSGRLRAALAIFAGHFRNPRALSVLQSLYRSETDERVRQALLSAIGNSGPAAGEFLLAELTASQSSFAIQRATVRALGSARYRPAVRELIRRLDEPELSACADRSLRRIAEQDFGSDRALWTRWWKAQPEAQAEPRDPDEA